MPQEQVVARSAPQFPSTLNANEIHVTPSAQVKLREIVASGAEDGVLGVRVYVAGGGCNGLTYGMVMAESASRFDTIWQADGLNIYIDAIALNYLDGAEIDYVEEDGEPKFLFRNVFARSGGGGACGGCGSGGCGSH